jgi:hypothetical protein
MTVPTAYTASQLQAFMLRTTGNLGTVLSLTTIDFEDAVTDVLLGYGVNTIESASDIAKLRALAKVEAWKVAKAKAAGRTDFDADGASFTRSQLIEQAQSNLEMAEQEAMVHGGLAGYAVTTAVFTYPGDPYPLPSDEDSA